MNSMMKTLIAVEAVRTPELVRGADAIRLAGGRIEAIGTAASLRGSGVAEVAFPGGVVFPLLADGHLHPLGYVQAVDGLSLGTVRDLGHLAEMIELHREVQPIGPIVGNRLDDKRLGRMPDRHALDRIERTRSVLVLRHCGHVAAANTTALERAGIGSGTPDPPGGAFDRDGDGRPTGVIRESAIAVVTRALDGSVPRSDPARLVEVLDGLPALGIGEIDAMASSGTPIWCGTGDELDQLLECEANLPITVNVFVITDSIDDLERAADRLRLAGNRLRFAGWKGFADGSLGGHTAAMWAPFSDLASSNGILRLDPTRDRPLIDRALSLGGSVAIHAIGDRANTAVLSLYERLVGEGVDPARLRLEHASVLSKGLVEHVARLGVRASVQPSFLTSEASWVPARLGPDRLRYTYPFESLRSAGVELIGGSDCPVEDPNPWPAVAAARAHPLNPDESLDANAAIGMYLRTRLVRDQLASFAVLDRDPIDSSPNELAKTSVLAAWHDGNRAAARPAVWPG